MFQKHVKAASWELEYFLVSLSVLQDDEEEFAPENVTFAPKDVTPVDFNPRLGVQGLGYRGLDPGLALQGRGASEHIDLFNPQSDTRSRLFGDAPRGSRRGGVAGQVGFLLSETLFYRKKFLL